MEKIIFASFNIAIVLFYIYQTDVVFSYLRLLGSYLGKTRLGGIFFYGILMLKAFEKRTDNQSYLDTINKIYNNFITNLISCAICVGFWASAIYAYCLGNLQSFGIIAFISLSLFYLIKMLTKLSAKL